MSAPVDRAWLNGRVFTGSGFAEAFLVENGTIAAVGPDDAVRRAKGNGADTVDLRGKLVLPGLIDLHMHLTDTVLAREGVDLRGTRSREEFAARIRDGLRPGSRSALVAVGWDSALWAESREPTREELDRIVPDRPLIVFQVSMHAAVLNSAAWNTLGIEEDPRDPPGGRFGRDASGRVNGVLYDAAMQRLEGSAERADWSRSNAAAYDRLLHYAASLGLTTVCPVLARPEEIETVATLSDGRLPLRLRFYLDLRSLDRYEALPRPSPEASWKISGVKAITDGAFGTRTAWLESPYTDAPSVQGFPIWSDEELIAALTHAGERGLAPALHAIGDRALARVLAVLARAPVVDPVRIEHGSLTPPTLWPALEERRPHLVVEPHFVETDQWILTRLGPARAQWTYAFRTLTDHGFALGGASDSPVEPLDPWTGLRAAVFRAPWSPFGRLTASERLAPIEAFQLYTRNAGPILGEPSLGRIAEGSPADFVLTSSTSLDGALHSERPPVAETWVGGRRSFPASAA